MGRKMQVFVDILSMGKNAAKRVPKVVWIGFVAAIVLMVVVTAVSWGQANKTAFRDTGVLKNIPAERIKNYEEFLKKNIEYDVGNVNDEIIRDVVIREDTYKETQGGDEKRSYIDSEFVIDIDSIERTYDILVRWTESESEYQMQDVGIRVNCDLSESSKYPEAKCKTLTSSYKDYEGTGSFSDSGDNGSSNGSGKEADGE